MCGYRRCRHSDYVNTYVVRSLHQRVAVEICYVDVWLITNGLRICVTVANLHFIVPHILFTKSMEVIGNNNQSIILGECLTFLASGSDPTI